MYRKIKAILLLSVILSYGFLQANLKKATTLLKKGDYSDAAFLFHRVAEKNQESRTKSALLAHYGAGFSLKSLDLNISSLPYYERVVLAGPKANPYFLRSLAALFEIQEILSLDDDYLASLMGKIRVNPKALPDNLKGFFAYYKGKSLYKEGDYKKALKYFAFVSDIDPYYTKSLFYRAVCEGVLGREKSSVKHFESLLGDLEGSSEYDNMRDQALLNLGRVNYGSGDFEKAIEYYGAVSRNSPFWLEALFEGSWAFSILENPSNTLGNIHTIASPFFAQHFYPEAFILRIITLSELCYYDEVKALVEDFTKDFEPMSKKLEATLKKLKGGRGVAFSYVRDGDLSSRKTIPFIIKSSRHLTSYKKAILFQDNLEIERIEIGANFDSSQRAPFIKSSEAVKKEVVSLVDKKILAHAEFSHGHLKEMLEQLILIEADLLLENIARIKKELNLQKTDGDHEFIGGMKKLVLGQALEYWPFDGEHWEDELGGYVYNIPNLCRK